MIRINIHEAKTNLSKYLGNLEKGETILLCKRNIPIAEIRPIPVKVKSLRPVGLAKGQFEIPDSFYAPLPSEIMDGFYNADMMKSHENSA